LQRHRLALDLSQLSRRDPRFLSAISLRQCRSARRRIAEPPFCRGPSIGSGQPVALDDQYPHIIRRYRARLNFEQGGLLLFAARRHGWEKYGFAGQSKLAAIRAFQSLVHLWVYLWTTQESIGTHRFL
jgi:hypothetical protein